MQVERVFLLGGYDLEMEEIKKILTDNREKYIDKQLSWGAKVSDYKDYLNLDETIIYGVELEVDIQVPKNYHEIDHHGLNDHKPSSLEQVAQILDLKLTQKQKLIAANDSRYIGGMKKLCARQKEIDEIRQRDRELQGITRYDEDIAAASVKMSDSNIIYSITSHFSATSDIAYYSYDNYIIYNYSKVVFYGYQRDQIFKFLDSLSIKKENCYYGGGEFGFVGIKENTLEIKQIKKVIEEFGKVDKNQEKIYSYHTFMLPFTYEKNCKKDIIKGWQKGKYNFSYNEKAYFHDFFIKSIDSAAFYTRSYANDEFLMCKSEEYRLKLDSTYLRLFDDFNIGVLTINLKNTNHCNTKAILEINDFVRRLYPEYLDYKNELSGLVPKRVKFNGIEEEFTFDKELKEPKISQIIDQFIPTLKIKKAVDDRMFTISYFNNPKLAKEIKENYICNDQWYEYVFVDGNGKTVQNLSMQEKLIKKATYERWRDYGTLYGMSKYSFVCLANSDFPLPHIQTMYLSMFSLLLMVRATLLKFADDVSAIAKDIDTKDISSQVNDLYKDYIKFINKYYFREITAKDQGIELYEKALDILNVERDIKDLDREIAELFKYVELQSEKKSAEENKKINKKLEKIQLIGGVLLGVSVLTGFFGMNVGDTNNNFPWWFVILALVIPTWWGYKEFYKGES